MLSRRSRAAVALTALVAGGVVAGGTELGSTTGESAGRSARGGAVSQTVALGPALGRQARPNIVVIMADDMREDELEHMPRTRELLEDQGVRFVNSFSPHPMCCPARASFLTGKYTHNHKVWANRGPYGGFPAFDDSDTLPVGLSRAGYNTVFVGKYLNGYGRTPFPDGSPTVTYVPPGWSDWRASVDGPSGWDHPDAGGTYHYFDTTLNINGSLRGNQGWYQTRMLGAESRDVISTYARSPRPFFLWASYVAPHVGSPVEEGDPEPVERGNGYVNKFQTPAVPADVRDQFDSTITRAPGDDGEAHVGDKPFFIRNQPPADPAERAALTEVARQRAEALLVLDQEVARTVASLERADELEETIVMFTSDNGYLLGEHRVRQGKLLPYEPSLRVPLLVRGPGIAGGELRTEPVLTIDFAPTFLDLAGAQPNPGIDGDAFLDRKRRGWTRAILTETGPRPLTSTTKDGTLPPGADSLRFTQGVRTRRYLYVEHATGEREFYDLRSDPEELENVVERRGFAPVVGQMAAVLDRLRNCVADACREPVARSLHR